MSPAISLPAIILDTVLGRLALLFMTGANGDLSAARQAARQMLVAYHPETEDELRLAAEIISFSFHALEALSQAASPEMPLAKILRLRGSAVGLSREAHKSQRKLDHLQRNRHTEPAKPAPIATAQPPEPAPARPHIDKALDLIEATRQAMAASPGNNHAKTWTQSYQQRLAARRIAENLRKNQAKHATEAGQGNKAGEDVSQTAEPMIMPGDASLRAD
jgi:hypothetical protein